jgi:cellulose synthase/poly-beta-1,6-N-acetylglucosamine synthase-like glycosyltransferase
MGKQDIPKEKKLIESITYSFGKAMSLLFGCIVGFSFITAIALSYEYGLIGWSIIGYKLMKVFLIIGVIYIVMILSKTIVYKSNEKVNSINKERVMRRHIFKKEIKKEIVKELKDGRSSKRR